MTASKPAYTTPYGRSMTTYRRPRSWLAVVVVVAAVLLCLMAIVSGFGPRWGWWHFSTGFQMLRWSAYGGMVVGVLSLVAIYHTRPSAPRRGLPLAVIGLVLSILLVGGLWGLQQYARSVPPIHDITTDTENPPQFIAVAQQREEAPNEVEYPGEEVAAQQREAYPDVQPLILEMPSESAFDVALEAARRMGWEIHEADDQNLRIEATATTFWYGFLDDVSIRLTPQNGQTVVDVRSASRVGRGDLGVNARRVRSFISRVERLSQS